MLGPDLATKTLRKTPKKSIHMYTAVKQQGLGGRRTVNAESESYSPEI